MPALILKRRPAYLYAYLGGLSSLLDFFNTFTKHSSNWDYSIVSIALIYSLSPSLTINPMYKTYIYKAFHGLGPEVGFEPTTFWLWARQATSAPLRYMVIPRGVEPRSWEWKSHVLTTRLRDHFLWIHSAELSDTTWRRILCRQLSRRRAKGSNKKEKHIKALWFILTLCQLSYFPIGGEDRSRTYDIKFPKIRIAVRAFLYFL